MPQKISLNKTKETFDKLLAQAKESVKVLETLQKEGVARARAVLHMPTKELAQSLTNERVVATLKKLGLATRTEVRDLEKRVEELASELRTQINQVAKTARKTQKTKSDKDETPEVLS